MNIGLKALFERTAPAMAAVTVKNRDGDEENGSGFHVGDGWVVTARHVAERLIGVVPEGTTTALEVDNVYLGEEESDLAALHCEYPTEVHVDIGGHLDDWLADDQFILSEVMLMGYPKIPFAHGPVLVTARGEVNAVLDLRGRPHPHFLISATPRGGFSGSPVMSEFNFALGVLTDALVWADEAAPYGHAASVSVEPLWNLLHEHRIYPGRNAEFLREVYDG